MCWKQPVKDWMCLGSDSIFQNQALTSVFFGLKDKWVWGAGGGQFSLMEGWPLPWVRWDHTPSPLTRGGGVIYKGSPLYHWTLAMSYLTVFRNIGKLSQTILRKESHQMFMKNLLKLTLWEDWGKTLCIWNLIYFFKKHLYLELIFFSRGPF